MDISLNSCAITFQQRDNFYHLHSNSIAKVVLISVVSVCRCMCV